MLQPLKGASNQNPITPISLPSYAAQSEPLPIDNAPQLPVSPTIGSEVRFATREIPKMPETPNSLEGLKSNLSQSPEKIEDFLKKLGAHSYEYNQPEKHGEGTFVSPMAQEFEKSEIGKTAVVDGPDGKMVDYGRLAGTELAALANQQRDISQIKDALGLVDKVKKGDEGDEGVLSGARNVLGFVAPGIKGAAGSLTKERDISLGEGNLISPDDKGIMDFLAEIVKQRKAHVKDKE